MNSENTSDNTQAKALNKTDVSSSYSTDLFFENVEQMLIESIADFLDSEEILIQESISELKDPIEREKTELHIRMAKASMKEYEKTLLNIKNKIVNKCNYAMPDCDNCALANCIYLNDGGL